MTKTIQVAALLAFVLLLAGIFQAAATQTVGFGAYKLVQGETGVWHLSGVDIPGIND